MTLVVGCVRGRTVAIAADTLLVEHQMPLPMHRGTIKSCILPGDICVSFSNSPELANNSFKAFCEEFPSGAAFALTIAFFEEWSTSTGNDYLVAFSNPAKIVKIIDGQRQPTLTDTVWIGDREAYSRFRQYAQRKRQRPQAGRAINAAYFADEPTDSPASNLFSALRNVVADDDVKAVGGFVSVISNRDNGFRHSAYSDMLFDWPAGQSSNYDFRYELPIALSSTNENARFAVAQISSGYMGLNAIAFYLTRGRKLFFYHGEGNLLPTKCQVFSDVEPNRISQTLSDFVGIDLGWLLTITSPDNRIEPRLFSKGWGSQFAFVCEANTFPTADEARHSGRAKRDPESRGS